MQRTVTMTVRAAPEDVPKLERTVATFNTACDWISGVACAEDVFNTVRLHHRVYYEARARFSPLQSQFVVRAIGVVADAYRRDNQVRHRFRPEGAVVYDERLYRFEPKGGYQRVSLTTVEGRVVCDLALGGHQRAILGRATKIGQADLLRDRKGRWRLHLTVTLPDPGPADASGGVLGVDLGIKNLAADSDGARYAGNVVNGLRRRHQRTRTRLQRKGTHAARRRLRQRSGRQARFQQDTNHRIAKALVATALSTHRAIAVEDLNGIRSRVRASRDQRRLLGNWGFFQLRSFVQHKAEAAGVVVYAVDPRHTSQACPRCGLIDRRNRPDQATFSCVGCGFAGHADHVAAVNIARRGALAAGLPVNQPHVPDAGANPRGLCQSVHALGTPVAPGTSCPL